MRKKRNFHIKSINLRIRKKIFIFLLIIVLISSLILCYMKYLMNPVIFNTTESKVKTFANRSMNIAVTTAMNQGIAYSDLIKIEMENGKTTLLQANSVKINALAKMITRTIQQNLSELLEDPITIKIGSFTGIPIFNGLGPGVKITLTPFGDISCKFSSEFISAGINQTQHKIYLNIATNVNIVFSNKVVKVLAKTDVLICESIIIGEIPTTFLKSDSLDEMMNLIPL